MYIYIFISILFVIFIFFYTFPNIFVIRTFHYCNMRQFIARSYSAYSVAYIACMPLQLCFPSLMRPQCSQKSEARSRLQDYDVSCIQWRRRYSYMHGITSQLTISCEWSSIIYIVVSEYINNIALDFQYVYKHKYGIIYSHILGIG